MASVTNNTNQAVEVEYDVTWGGLYGLTPSAWAQFVGVTGANGGNGGSLVVQPGQTVSLPASLPKSALPALLS